MSLNKLTDTKEKTWLKGGFEDLTVYGTFINSGGTANTVAYFNSDKKLSGYALTNGQILIGSTSSTPLPGTITGTANQVVVTNGAASITLSTPQNIGTASTPTFAALSLTTQSCIIAHNTTAQSLTDTTSTTATYTAVTTIGTGLTYSSGTFTSSVDATYLVQVSADFAASATGLRSVIVNVTSAGQSAGNNGTIQVGGVASITLYLPTSAIIKLSATDTFTIKLFQSSGGALNCNGSGQLTISKLY